MSDEKWLGFPAIFLPDNYDVNKFYQRVAGIHFL